MNGEDTLALSFCSQWQERRRRRTRSFVDGAAVRLQDGNAQYGAGRNASPIQRVAAGTSVLVCPRTATEPKAVSVAVGI